MHGTIESVGETVAHNGKAVCLTAGPAASPSANATLSVALGASGQRLNHVWKAAVGSSHASTSLRGDWQAHLRNASEAIGFKAVRFHGIFKDDILHMKPNGASGYMDPTAIPVEWVDIDKSYDNILSLGMKPFVELSFLPQFVANCSNG